MTIIHSLIYSPNPVPYVEHWLKENHHSASDAPTGKPSNDESVSSTISVLFS
jgi:hypothetical protein